MSLQIQKYQWAYKTPQSVIALALCILMSLLSGCDQLNSQAFKSIVQEPAVSVDKLTITGVNMNSIGLLLRLKVDNPNSYKLALSGYEYQVKFNERKFLDGKTEQGFSVPALASSSVDVPLTIGFKQAMNLLSEAGDNNQLRYDVSADIKLDAPVLNLFSIHTSKQGQITIPQIPDVSFGELTVKNLSFTEASFELAMNITNPNNFGLNLKDIHYQFSKGSEKWFSGAIEQPVNLSKKQTTTVKIPVNISILKLGSGVLSSLQNGSFTDYTLDANFIVDSDYPALQNLKVPIHYAP